MPPRPSLTLSGHKPVAQQSAIPIVGFLSTNQSAAVPHFTAAFREGLAEAGFIDGKNVTIEFRFAEQRLERVPALAMDLVRRQVAVIFTAGGDVPAMVAILRRSRLFS